MLILRMVWDAEVDFIPNLRKLGNHINKSFFNNNKSFINIDKS